MTGGCFYNVLGLPRDSSPEEIRAAYKRLVMELHPDRGGTANEARFKLVSVAYAHLSDPALKASYDASSQPRVYTSVKPPLNRMQRSTSEMCPTRYEVAPEGSVMQQQLLRRYTSRWQSPSKTHSAPTPPKKSYNGDVPSTEPHCGAGTEQAVARGVTNANAPGPFTWEVPRCREVSHRLKYF